MITAWNENRLIKLHNSAIHILKFFCKTAGCPPGNSDYFKLYTSFNGYFIHTINSPPPSFSH
jgi:hypothetical protein